MQRFKDAEIQRCILQTLSYADIFEYPLTENEIWQWLISSFPLISFSPPLKSFKKELRELISKGKIVYRNGFYFLPSREKTMVIRAEREKWSLEKLKIASQTAEKLKNLPWIKMIGVTGALAMKNCDEDDDIDLIIITAKNLLWLTRLLLLILCPALGIKRRKPKETNVQDKICFNLFLDEEHLKIKPENLFTAHEICQVKPLVDKDKTYERFLWENRWVKRYLPNTLDSSKFKIQNSKLQFKAQSLLSGLSCFLDKIAYLLQYNYMKKKITNEKISLHQAFFHPVLLGKKIEGEYELRLKKYNINNG